jgi:transcriptional regulator with XRE-family HTH domain
MTFQLPIESIQTAERLKTARIAARLQVADMACQLGVSLAEYGDMESFDDELWTCVRLETLERLAALLRVQTLWLLAGTERTGNQWTFAELSVFITEFLKREHVALTDFEERVGWLIRDALTTPKSIGHWNIVQLMDVTNGLGLDWRSALP